MTTRKTTAAATAKARARARARATATVIAMTVALFFGEALEGADEGYCGEVFGGLGFDEE
jgi:hypothetical protein